MAQLRSLATLWWRHAAKSRLYLPVDPASWQLKCANKVVFDRLRSWPSQLKTQNGCRMQDRMPTRVHEKFKRAKFLRFQWLFEYHRNRTKIFQMKSNGWFDKRDFKFAIDKLGILIRPKICCRVAVMWSLHRVKTSRRHSFSSDLWKSCKDCEHELLMICKSRLQSQLRKMRKTSQF